MIFFFTLSSPLFFEVYAYTKTNGLALSGAKTQVMVGGKGKPPLTFTVNVDGEEVKPIGTFDLLGVTFDQNFTVRPYSLAREARFRSGRVARLAHHLPPGQPLRQLGSGLLIGKVAHCLPVLIWPSRGHNGAQGRRYAGKKFRVGFHGVQSDDKGHTPRQHARGGIWEGRNAKTKVKLKVKVKAKDHQASMRPRTMPPYTSFPKRDKRFRGG
jgi:hypothetical protein